MIKDFKGWLYQIVDIGHDTTLLLCESTGQYVRIRSWGWDEIGFIRP